MQPGLQVAAEGYRSQVMEAGQTEGEGEKHMGRLWSGRSYANLLQDLRGKSSCQTCQATARGPELKRNVRKLQISIKPLGRI
jgi:hypothetical protein